MTFVMNLNAFQNDSGDDQLVQFQVPKSLIRLQNQRFKEAKVICGAYEIESQELDKTLVVSAPLNYLLSAPGKNIRTRLIAALNQWLKVPEEKLQVISNAVELLHTASLLIDDIQDSSKLRRGLPVAHSIFGIAQTINSANNAYFLAQQKLEQLKNPQASIIFTEELLNLHRGQGMDLYWRDSLTCPTEEEYLEMVSNKTGGLFRLAVKLMQLESKHDSEDYIPLVDLLGISFQIRDDYQILWSDVYNDNKGLCEDLTEGKFSFPIIHSIRSNPGNLVLPSILKQKCSDDEVKFCAKHLMEATQSDKYTRQEICTLIKRARILVEKLTAEVGKAPEIEAILDYLESE